MKKILIILIMCVLLTGCASTQATSATTTASTTTTEGTIPNGLEPLTAATDCEEAYMDGGWVCIWADEFSGTEVDLTKWTYEINGDGGGNQELQYYTDANATVADGILSITAKNESYLGKSYTSSRLNSKYKGDFQYVRVIARAKMPTGVGTWPAIWMMPTMSEYGGWPDSGEIDIMEYVGYDPDVIHSTIHTERFNHMLGTQISYTKAVENAETEYHDYQLDWYPGHMVAYVDGVKIGEFNYAASFTDEYPYYECFPFDSPFYLILNLAVGGSWGGAEGVDPDAFPTALQVDYVRVYKLDYATIDQTAPTTPEDIHLAELADTIYWDASDDDYGVEQYAIYVDGVLRDYSSLNQYTFTNLTAGNTYSIQIQAVDFVGRTSELSGTLLFTFSG